MKFVAGGLNGQYLAEIQRNSIDKADAVRVAIAYVTGTPQLFQDCWDHKIKLTFWGRYDHSVPVSLSVLKTFLDRKSPNYSCKLIADIFHSKVIWWEGYGAYIGSANLTDRAWYGNIEAGIFLTDEELLESELDKDLHNYFEEIDKRSSPLTDEVYKELLECNNSMKDVRTSENTVFEEFNKRRSIPILEPLARISNITSHERRKNIFLSEWRETLQILRDISTRVSEDNYRPAWVRSDVPRGVQVDQFLHAYYYDLVKRGNKSTHYLLYVENKCDPEAALVTAMNWWKHTTKAPHSEDRVMYEWAQVIKTNLVANSLLNLSKSDFIALCSRIHALRDHAQRIKYTEYGLDAKLPTMDEDERIDYLAKWLYGQTSNGGYTVLQTLNYVLYGGNSEEAPERLWEATENDKWKIPHLGISSLGEIVGWAMPDIFPPRNGRTSKALTALGYKVRIHSE